MINLIIIDIDDTLCMTEEACFSLENETLSLIGAKNFDRDIHIKTWGEPLFEAIKKRSPGVNVQEFRETFGVKLNDYIHKGKLDKIPNRNYVCLKNLKSRGFKIGIITSRTRLESLHLDSESHELTKISDYFYSKDDTKYHKPDPRVFDEILSESSFKPEQCVYIGDSLSDCAAAKLAGLKFIACLESGLRSREDFEELDYKPDVYIARFSDLEKVQVDGLELSLSLEKA